MTPDDTFPTQDDYVNQACAELAFAKAMGWHDWTHGEESDAGMVRGYRVQWSPDPNAGLVVHDEDDDDARYVLPTSRERRRDPDRRSPAAPIAVRSRGG